MTATGRLPRAGVALRKAALAYPGAQEDMPWGHHAIKVWGKTLWIEESCGAMAPKRLVAEVEAEAKGRSRRSSL
jgi:hypothetical protein